MKATILNSILFFAIAFTLISCGSIKSTLKTVDNSQPKPAIVDGHFEVTEYANNFKYAYDADYPVTVGFDNEKFGEKSVALFLNALEGEDSSPFSFKKIDNCCPFPSKRSAMGGGILEIYEIIFSTNAKKVRLYFNINDKGKLLCPKGFKIKPIKISETKK